jgi:hypothetical protein
VEDSGDWCSFIEGVRNAAFPNLISPNLCIAKPCIPHMSISVKPVYKVWALYMQNHGLSSLFMHEYALKSSAIFFEMILIFLKNLKKVYKGLEKFKKLQ